MKTITFTILFSLMIAGTTVSAQTTVTGENYGKTLNTGIGLGYFGYVGHTVPIIHLNYELAVAKNFTIAPFITYFSYQNNYYWGNKNYPYRNYSYRETVIPIGLKGSYYFDQLFNANSKWDFYLAASLGFSLQSTTWENGYDGERTVQHGSSGLYLDGHIGTEYHLNQKVGLYLDLSTGISSFGLAIHL